MRDADGSEISLRLRIAIVGTGPLSLLKAHFISLQNPKAEITLFDSGSQAGGAWYSDYSPKGHLIECGCHIWSYAPSAYKFIEDELGVKLVAMLPPPVFVGKLVSLPYALKNTIDNYKAFVKLVLKLKFSALKDHNQKPSVHYRIFGKKNKYPRTGSPELIHALEKKIASNERIKIILNTRLTELEIGSAVKVTAADQRYEFDKVFLTYVSHVTRLILPSEIITTTPKQVDYIHFLIGSDKPLKKKMTYWRLMNDPVVHRITDISYQTNFEENLVLVGIKGDAFHSQSEDQLFTHVKNLMISLKLIGGDQTFVLIKTHVFPTYYMDALSHQSLTNYKNKVELLPTTDLMYGLHYLLRDEMPHLIKTPK